MTHCTSEQLQVTENYKFQCDSTATVASVCFVSKLSLETETLTSLSPGGDVTRGTGASPQLVTASPVRKRAALDEHLDIMKAWL